MEFTQWVSENWQSITTALGVGTGGGAIGKKIMDKETNKKITKLENRLQSLEHDVKENSIRDENRDSMIAMLSKQMDKMDAKLDKLLMK